MDGNPTKLFAHHLAFAGMNASADPETKRLDSVDNRPATSHRTRRSIECRQKSIACRINLATAMTLELLAHEKVMLIEKLFPCPVTDFACSLGCVHDIGEQHGGEHAIMLGSATHTSQESLDFPYRASTSPTHGRWSS